MHAFNMKYFLENINDHISVGRSWIDFVLESKFNDDAIKLDEDVHWQLEISVNA